MNLTPEIVHTDITLIGEFRPAMFSAAWLASRGLVRKSDVDEENADEEKVRNEFYQIRSPAFTLFVTQNRMTVQGPSSSAPIVKDLVLALLQINAASAVRALGMNFQAHYKCSSEAQWHSVGHHLAPKEMWAELFPDTHVGMKSLTMRIGSEQDVSRWIELTVQPSAQVKHGVYFLWNDHHAMEKIQDDPEAGVVQAIDVISTNYDRLCTESYNKFSETLAHATK